MEVGWGGVGGRVKVGVEEVWSWGRVGWRGRRWGGLEEG